MTGFDIDIRSKRFPAVGRAAAREALRDVRFTIDEGAFVCVAGPSGCGKTTLLNIVAGLDRDFDGSIVRHGDRAPRPVIGYVFQTPRLLPWRTVRENVDLVLAPQDTSGAFVDDLLATCGLEDAHHVYASRLSVGMARRVALARAFAVRPELLLMDEPFVSLDEQIATRLRRLLVEVWRARPTTVLFVTHDLGEAVFLADRILFLSSSPATLVADVPIELTRDQRDDARAVEAVRETLATRAGGAALA